MIEWNMYMILWLTLCIIFIVAIALFVLGNLYIQMKLNSIMKELDRLEHKNQNTK